MTSFSPRLTGSVGLSPVRCGPRQLPEPTIELFRIDARNSVNRRSIALRSPSYERRGVLTIVEAAEPSRLRTVERSDGAEEEKIQACLYEVRNQGTEDLTANKCAIAESLRENDSGTRNRNRTVEVLLAAAATVVLGVGNRVLYKLALVPLKHYPFFLAQLATFGYVIVYFSILYIRYQAGFVTKEMLSMPKAPFLAVGLLEALAAATGMAAAAILSGTSIPILSQSFLVWQIILSIIFLRRRYKPNQLLGCFLVGIGVILTVASGSSAGSLMEAGLFWSCLMILSFLLQAADTVLKEIIFLNASRQLKGRTVDLFVVNSFGSAFQALFLFALLPFLSRLWGIPFSQLPNYMLDGAACFLNLGSGTLTGCDGAPLLPLLFIIVNMGYNISLLYLLKISSAVVSSLASTFSVPISIYLFTLPLPYIGVASPLPTGFINGAIILAIGLLVYTWTPSRVPNTLPINQKVAADSAPYPR